MGDGELRLSSKKLWWIGVFSWGAVEEQRWNDEGCCGVGFGGGGGEQ